MSPGDREFNSIAVQATWHRRLHSAADFWARVPIRPSFGLKSSSQVNMSIAESWDARHPDKGTAHHKGKPEASRLCPNNRLRDER